MKKNGYIAVFALMLVCHAVSARNDAFEHAVGLNVRPSYIMPTHGFYNGYNPLGKPLRAGGSAHLNYSFSYAPESSVGKIYPGAYQGIGIGVQTFQAHDALGTPASIYLFQGAPFARLHDRLSLDYEWNLGLSAGWKPNEYLLTGSRLNIYINVGVFLRWRLSKLWDVQIGPEYTHYSNGDTTFPNGGANTINFRLGARMCFGRDDLSGARPVLFLRDDKEGDFAERLTYDLTAFGAWRADRMVIGYDLHIINHPFLIAGLQLNPLYHLNQSLSFGPSIDIIYDRSANLQVSVNDDKMLSYSYPSFMSQISAGVSARGELRMPIFAVNFGAGYNFSYSSSDLKGLYAIFMLKAFMNDHFYLNIGYRLSSVLYSHNLMFGLGWRFYNKCITPNK